MKCKILHETPGRMRVRLFTGKSSTPDCTKARLTLEEADLFEYSLKSADGIEDVKVFDRTGDVIIHYTCTRETVIRSLASFSFEKARERDLVPAHTSRALNREFEEKLVVKTAARLLRKFFLPAPVRHVLTVFRAVRVIRDGIRCLLRGKLEVAVLDAAAIAVSILRGDFDTASSVMFLLGIGEMIEDWTHRKSVGDLASVLSLSVDKTWLRTPDGEEILVPVSDVKAGDTILVRTSGIIPLDGHVADGECSVNQASITGESLPVRKSPGSYVYAGTVVEEGECLIRVDKELGSGRYDRVVKMIEESEKMKSESEARAAHLADRLVPWSLGGTILAWILTRNPTRALSFLMVDFSCALKLAMPLSTLSAMREAARLGINVKGGKFLEAAAEADTVVFDKTGTLTRATPAVAAVTPLDGQDRDELLRLAACLEEHFPHSVARAVVREAETRDLRHEERHTKVEYVIAHGISSFVDGERVLIGSRHFILEDENCALPEGSEPILETLPGDCSHLYLAINGTVAAVISIRDPLRPEAADTVKALKSLGVRHTVMMTGDSERTAAVVARAVGVDEYRAEVLPEDKAVFVREEQKAGRRVIMLGDGVNDSPALSEADAGIAVRDGAAIAREVADITMTGEDLAGLLTLRRLSMAYMDRIRGNYRRIIAFNFSLILFGVLGILPPASSAMLHNVSTLAFSLSSMTPLLKDERI